MKDLFSAHAKAYSAFRPTYPPELFDCILSLCAGKKLLWDCGTGNGQVAGVLAPRFERVLASDISAKQIAEAPQIENIEYVIGRAEQSGLPAESVDLVTVAQALHWFDHGPFFTEVARVLKPGGILAFWSYAFAQYPAGLSEIVGELYSVELDGFWEPERLLVEQNYASIAVPLPELRVPTFAMTATWSFDQFLGYLRTWSAVQTAIKKGVPDPVAKFEKRLRGAWGDAEKITVSWQLKPRVFRMS